MARRKFTLEDKIKIIEELNNGLTHAQVCKKYELTSSTLSTFKRQLDVINATQLLSPENILDNYLYIYYNVESDWR